jgi:hypothetical protein
MFCLTIKIANIYYHLVVRSVRINQINDLLMWSADTYVEDKNCK